MGFKKPFRSDPVKPGPVYKEKARRQLEVKRWREREQLEAKQQREREQVEAKQRREREQQQSYQAYQAKLQSKWKRQQLKRSIILGTCAFAGVFAIGMAATHWSALSEAISLSPAGEANLKTGFSTAGEVTAMPICSIVSRNCVHDGDTIHFHGERIRIANIDAPELPDSPKCHDRRAAYAWCDYDKGYKSRDALAAFLSRGPIAVSRQGRDKYGRTLATISVHGQDSGSYLVGLGLARWWR